MDLPPIIIYAAPVMFTLVFIEYIIRIRKLRREYDAKDAFAATAVGIGNIISSALTKVVTLWCSIVLLQYGALEPAHYLVVFSDLFCGA